MMIFTTVKRDTRPMAAHVDLKTRADAVGVAAEFYTSQPHALLREVQRAVTAGRWPVIVNVKGTRPDSTLIVVPLAHYETLTKGVDDNDQQ